LNSNEIRRGFLEFFAGRGHLILPSAPLIPERDPTTLLISAGMQPLKPYYQGVSEPPAPRLASSQKSFRTGDIDEVGKTDRHQTFFEMLGNFTPTGDYFKEGAIPFAWELVTDIFRLPKDRVRVTVHPTDDEADEYWKTLTDIRPDWVYRNTDNWWAAGATGPCGPDSELWYDRGRAYGCGQADCAPDHCERFLEFWNLVFMTYDQQADGSRPQLPHPGIDTGMGLERMSSILQGVDTTFDTDLFTPITAFIRANSERSLVASERLIADHVRGASFLIGDGVVPGTEGRGYVLRRLIRRSAHHARRIGLRTGIQAIVGTVADVMGEPYPELRERKAYIEEIVAGEAERFARTLEQGMEVFEQVVARSPGRIPGEDAFRLHDTFGFPVELTRELAEERGLVLDREGFESAMANQRVISRKITGQRWPDVKALPRSEFVGYTDPAAQSAVTAIFKAGQEVVEAFEGDEVEVFLERTPFYAESGGQVGDTGVIAAADGRFRVEDTQKPADGVTAHAGTVEVGTIRRGDMVRAEIDAARRELIAGHHSATHLLHRALRTVLGEGAVQRGSYVGPTHTTFDFAFNRALEPDEVRRVNRMINEQVRNALVLEVSHKPIAEARDTGAMALFGEKYADIVRVVCFGDWTCELCGGTHVRNTAAIGHVLITRESSVGAGLRRVEMVAGPAAEAAIEMRVEKLQARLESVTNDLGAQLKVAQKRVEKLQDELREARVGGGRAEVSIREGRVRWVAQEVAADGADDLRGWADRYLDVLGGSGVAIVTAGSQYVIKVSRDLLAEVDANNLKEPLGPGGGSAQLVQGRLRAKPAEAFAALEELLR